MKAKVFIICLVLQINYLIVLAQTPSDSLFAHKYKKALSLIDAKDFVSANNSFKEALTFNTILPDELAYYYGYTLIQLSKLSAGKNALDKYLNLTGDTGRFRGYALELIHLADCREEGSYFMEEGCLECHGSGHTLVDCRVCRAKGKQICNLCGGIGAVRRRTNFGENFTTCTRCAGTGETLCNVCGGNGAEETRCFACGGKGKVRVKKECDSLLLNIPK